MSKALLVAGGSPASQPLIVEFDTKYNLHNHSGVLNPSALKIGAATGRFNDTYDVGGDNTVVNVKVIGERMPARDSNRFCRLWASISRKAPVWLRARPRRI